jgi:hypothetical protein
MTRFGKCCRTLLAGSLVFGAAAVISVVAASLSASQAAATTPSGSVISLGPHSVISLAAPLRSGRQFQSKELLASLVATPGGGNAGLGGSLDSPKGVKAGSSGWTVAQSANILGKQGQFDADSCGSASSCMAVGSYLGAAGIQEALAEAASGDKWSIQKLPTTPADEGSAFYDVSCVSATACTAVGAYLNSSRTQVTLAEAWNGKSWSIETTPNPSGAVTTLVTGVSCTSATSCIAVGASENSSGNVTTLVEKRKGTSWSIVASPNPSGVQQSELNDLSCTSSSACTAVGEYIDGSSGGDDTLAEAWNGSSWSIETIPTPSGGGILSGVSCTTVGICSAVGEAVTQALAEEWNGSSWSIETVPNPSGEETSTLDGVACTSAGACTAVGAYGDNSGDQYTLTEEWNGSSWSVETTPDPFNARTSTLAGVACNSAGDCTAVGNYIDSSALGVTVAETSNGASWSVDTTPNPEGVSVNIDLSGVACSSTKACTAVGSYFVTDQAVGEAFTEAWNGTKWSVQTVPVPSGSLISSFSGVACTSAKACTAVGVYDNSSGVALPLTEAWNGTKWSVQTNPAPSGAQASTLKGVACTSANACTAVGYWIGSPYSQNALAEVWNGTSWSIETTPTPSGALATGLYGVTCTSAGGCTAVGSYLDSSGDVDTLAVSWNGSSSSVQTSPNPSGSQGSELNSVSCTSAGTCTAAGDYVDSSGDQDTLAEAWSGTGWSIETTPDPTGKGTNILSGVSCASAHACSAVGYYTDSAGNNVPLAEGWNGAKWSIQATPLPALQGALGAVACTGSSCTAAGDYADTTEVTLIEVRS